LHTDGQKHDIERFLGHLITFVIVLPQKYFNHSEQLCESLKLKAIKSWLRDLEVTWYRDGMNFQDPVFWPGYLKKKWRNISRTRPKFRWPY
jgi:hypothetical protein